MPAGESLNDLCLSTTFFDPNILIGPFEGYESTFNGFEIIQIPALETELEVLMDCPQHAELLEMLKSLKADVELYKSYVTQQKMFFGNI